MKQLKLVYIIECPDCIVEYESLKIQRQRENVIELNNPGFIEQIADTFICPECGKRGNIISLVLLNGKDKEQMIDLFQGDKL